MFHLLVYPVIVWKSNSSDSVQACFTFFVYTYKPGRIKTDDKYVIYNYLFSLYIKLVERYTGLKVNDRNKLSCYVDISGSGVEFNIKCHVKQDYVDISGSGVEFIILPCQARLYIKHDSKEFR